MYCLLRDWHLSRFSLSWAGVTAITALGSDVFHCARLLPSVPQAQNQYGDMHVGTLRGVLRMQSPLSFRLPNSAPSL